LLKAQYQRNMLIGLAVAVLAVTVPTLTAAYWPLAPKPGVPPGGYDPPDTIVISPEAFRPIHVTPARTPSRAAGGGGGAIRPGKVHRLRAVPDQAASELDLPGCGGWGGPLDAEADFGLPGPGGGDGAGLTIAADDTVYGLFDVVEQPPELVYTPEPVYPPLARRLGLEGRVVVHALVGIEGLVDSVVVASESEANLGFGEYARRVARESRFRPGIQGKTPVRCWVAFTVEFELED
jgi:protein TonB